MTIEADYYPDNWVVIKVMIGKPHYRVLAGWSGGYLTGDSWRMNSGITRVEEDEDYFYFYGSSGSCYAGRKDQYCLRMNNAYIWEGLQKDYGDKVEMLSGETEWMKMDWILS